MRTVMARAPRLVGYASAIGGAGEELVTAQVDELKRRFGDQLVDVLRDGPDDDESLTRAGLRRALWLISDGRADGLVVTQLERLTTSVIDLGDVLGWLRDAGARLVALDLKLDTAEENGRKIAEALMYVSDWPRRTTSERTKAALAARREHGRPAGRPAVPPDVAERIRVLRDQGLSLRKIAATLTAEGVPTARGAEKWTVSSLQRSLGYQRPGPAKRARRPELPPLPGE